MSSQRSTQASQASQRKALSPEEMKSLVSDTVLYLLSQDHTKHAIKRQDIGKTVMPNNRGAFKAVMEEAKKELKNVFGINLEELDQGRYILTSKFHPKPQYYQLQSPEIRSHKVLLMIVLSYIFMAGGTVKEVHMWNYLDQLGIYKEKKNQSDPYFGDVHKLMTKEFVSQLYLDYHKHPNSDPPIYEFETGKRAIAEVSRRSLLEFVSKMHNCPLETWHVQYAEVLEEDKAQGKN